MAHASWVSVSASSIRVAAGISSAMAMARWPAMATHSTESSASNSHGASCSALIPGHSVAGWVLSSIWLCTSKAVSLSRAIRARMRRRRRSSSRPARTVSAAVSTTIAIRARSERIVARSTLSGRSGSTWVLITNVHRVPTSTAPIIQGNWATPARRYRLKK
ncbi:hypothetical protein YM3MPS_10620 [Mycobacterium pseudoshottsii]|nr:hypothetical protein [Mycobacterium pseudoshottsii]RFZ59358.1 hypothetical protein DL240490_04373 [Mycobacterium marinum]BEH75259.1 hypothetical protein YM3MPS_10620 [Mycobacterium pseudoshottsii]